MGLVLVFTFGGTATLLAQARLDTFGVGKKMDYLQNASATPTSHTIMGDPNGPFHFSADIGGANLTQLTTTPKVSLPNATQFTLTGTASAMGYARSFSGKTALDTAFPDGSYTINAGGSNLPCPLGNNDAYPAEIPQVTNGTWDGQGRLVINATAGGTVTFNNFSNYSGGIGGIITFNLYAVSGTTLGSELAATQSLALNGYTSDPALTSYTIAPGQLQPDRTYYAELSFARIVNLNIDYLATLGAVGVSSFLNTTGLIISTAAPATAPVITTQPSSQTVSVGANLSFSVVASGNPSPGFQWRKDGVTIGGATFASYALSNVQPADAGSYTVVVSNGAGAVTSNAAVLIVNGTSSAPAITTQPVSQTVTIGSSATFSAAASGSPTPTYQWQKDTVNLAGATNALLTINNIQASDAGSYTLIATNSVNTAISSVATLTVTSAPVAPAITTQPVSQTVAAGSSVTFSAAASGNPAPTFQWQKDNVNLSGATNASLTITITQPADAGSYTVIATNSVNTATSNAATLTINPAAVAPVFTVPPISQSVAVGTSVSFTVSVTGSPAPSIQWQKNGINLGGATGSSLALSSVLLTDAGSYQAVATNSAGTATSAAATLIVGSYPAGFDAAAYLARYPDVAAIYGTDYAGAWLYYRNNGIYQGEVYDELFRVEEYLALYPELFALFGNNLGGALEHWLTEGQIEGRLGRIPLEFSAQGYFDRNPDVAAAVNQNPILAWGHFWAYGIYEGRAYDEEFRAFEYLAINADLTAVFVNDWRGATLHWMRYGRTEGRLGRIPLIFSATEYLNRYPEVGAAWGTYPTTVWLHFWVYGIDEGRTFDEEFRVDEYIALNPDLAAIFGTNRRGAFTHWVRYGRNEGRLGRNP